MTPQKIYGWNGFRFSAQDVSLGIVPEIGGRIISLTFQGEEIFFVQKEFAGETFDFSQTSALRAKKRELGFRVWGGDKTWVAPQKDWWEGIPPLELDAGVYQATPLENGMRLISSICRETHIQIKRQVTLQSDGAVHLEQEITNHGQSPVLKGIWNVTQLNRPFDVYLPTTKDKLRSYHEEDLSLPNHHVVVQEDNGWSCIPCQDNQLFKFGGMVNQGAMLSVRKDARGTLAFLKTFDLDIDADYVHRSAVEVFNAMDHAYLEIEIHAPRLLLKPGQSCRHAQQWRLKRFTDTMTPQQMFESMTVKS